MGAKCREYLKWAATIAVVVLAVAVIAAAVTNSRRAEHAAGEGETQGGAPAELEGFIENAYIVSSDGFLTVHYAGREYTLEGRSKGRMPALPIWKSQKAACCR